MKKILLLTFALVQFAAFSQNRYYLTSSSGEAFNYNGNITAMNQAFGNSWSTAFFQTANPNVIFNANSCFVYMDGTASNSAAMNNFLAANLPAIQNWVSNGGKLFINACLITASTLNLGFGGHLNSFGNVYLSSSVTATSGETAHPIFSGPFSPAGLTYVGTYASNCNISGPSIPIMDGSAGGAKVLRELPYGSGRVIFGALQAGLWMSPPLYSINLKSNILFYLGGGYVINAIAANYPNVCPGGSSTVAATAIGNGTLTWYPGGITGNTMVVTPTVNTVYTCVATSTSGCPHSATVAVNIQPFNVNISANNNCSLYVWTTLTASGASTYSWVNGPQTATYSVFPQSTTIYTVTATNTITGCSGTFTYPIGAPDLSVTINPGSICQGASVLLTAAGADSYSWSTGATTYSTIDSPIAGTFYTVTGTFNQTGCSSQFVPYVNVYLCTGLEEEELAGDLKLFPNPSSGNFHVESSSPSTEIEIYDALGTLVQRSVGNTQGEFYFNEALRNGVYLIRIKDRNQTYTQKLVLSR